MAVEPISLVAKNPFELRIDLGARMSEGDVRAALASGDMGSILEQLTKLGELKAAGVLTDAEFEAQKARILAS